MRGERVYGVSLFPLDKQNVTIDGLLNLRWTNRSIRDPFSRYALTFFEHMYTYETIHGHVGYSCLLLDILNIPGEKRDQKTQTQGPSRTSDSCLQTGAGFLGPFYPHGAAGAPAVAR